MTISPTSRRWLAIAVLLLGAVLLWIGYTQDAQRDAYYDCRQSAMDGLHHSLSTEMDEDPDPDVWVPKWSESFREWHLMLRACKTSTPYDWVDR